MTKPARKSVASWVLQTLPAEGDPKRAVDFSSSGRVEDEQFLQNSKYDGGNSLQELRKNALPSVFKDVATPVLL